MRPIRSIHRSLAVATVTLCSGLCLVASGTSQSAQAQSQTGQVTPPPQALAVAPASTPTPASTAPKAVLAPLPEVQALLDQGKAAMDARKYDDAEKVYRQALALAQARGDKVGENRSLRAVGNIFNSTNRSADALSYYQQALVIARAISDKSGEANAQRNIGLIYVQTGRPAEALTTYQQALLLCRAAGDESSEIKVLNSIAVVYGTTGRPAEVLVDYQQVLMLCRAVGNKRDEAAALNNIGLIYGQTGRPAEALTTYQQALPLLRTLGDKSGEANVLLNIGGVYGSTGRPSEALTNYQQALLLCRAAGDKTSEAKVLSNIGGVYESTGRRSEALTNYQQALPLFRTTGDKSSEARVLNNIGVVYKDTSRPVEALTTYQQALLLCRATGDKSTEANVLSNIGAVYLGNGHPSEALTNYQQALLLCRAVGNKRSEATALDCLGSIYRDIGRPSEMLTTYQQALTLFRTLGDKSGEASVLNNIGAAYNGTGRLAEALTKYQQALALYRTLGNKSEEAFELLNEAKLERKLGQPEVAKADYAESIDLIEQVRTNLGGYTSAKQAYSASFRSSYSNYLDFLLAAPQNVKKTFLSSTSAAFTLAQQTKGRALLDLLDSGQVDLTGSLTDGEQAQLRTLRQESDALNGRLVMEGVENEVGAKARFAALQQQQREAESKLQRFTETLYAQHPDLAAKRSAKTASVADLAPLLDADTALLEYVQTTPGHIALFVVTKNAASATGMCEVKTLYLKVPASLAADCSAFQASCADPRKDYRPLAASLYKILIDPVVFSINGKKRLIVCPDGPLWNVPFQALLAGSGKVASFLADRYEIDYAYSATGALAAHTERLRQQAGPIRGNSLLVVANPSFGDAKRFGDLDDLPGQRPMDAPSRPLDLPSRPLDAPSRPLDIPSRAMAAALERAGGHIAALPGTQREAAALQHLYPDATVLTGDAAQEGVVKKDAAHYRYLHFATHGFINDGAPMLSSLVLAQPDAAAKVAGDDGFLTARELFDLRLPQTEMVTLSACNTGRGDIQSGEGVVGLTWALFAAGCPTEVASQWSVDDACTATLMTRFYTELKAGKPKGQALHDAARATETEGGADGPHRHPYYWAPFVMFGEWK